VPLLRSDPSRAAFVCWPSSDIWCSCTGICRGNRHGLVNYITTQYWLGGLAKVGSPTLIVAPRGDAIGNANAYRQMSELSRAGEFVTYNVESHNMSDYIKYRCAAMNFLERRFLS
jgi:hypothetical protein